MARKNKIGWKYLTKAEQNAYARAKQAIYRQQAREAPRVKLPKTHKKCAECQEVKSIEGNFYVVKNGKYLSSFCKPCNKAVAHAWRVRNNFGMSAEEYRVRVTMRVCEICKIPGRRMAQDHCHKTGKLRGALCLNCNSILGFAKDNPVTLRAAIEYLAARGV